MRKIILLFLLNFAFYFTKAQVLRIATSPAAIASQVPGYNEVSTITTKTFSYTPSTPPSSPTPVDDDSTTEDDKLYWYADNLAVNINLADGNVTNTSIGKVWTVRISIPNVLNIGGVFNQFNLAPTAEMYIFNEARTALDSAIKQANFTNSTSVGIAPFKGNSIIVYIVEPNNFGNFQSTISINNLEAGFQEIYDVGDVNSGSPSARVASVNCDPLIQCYPDKIPFARAVARFFSNGFQGTGTLINNEGYNGRAYFLTAFHILDVNRNIFNKPSGNGVLDPDEIAALANARFQFQFWRTQCNGSTNNQFIRFSGAVVRASWPNSDVVLLELINPPGIGDLVNYAGWNRQISAPSNNSSFIIHHPQGQDMRITSTSSVNNWFWNTNYWSAHYYTGTVDRGSSGAALMNEYGQIVGQLRSGWTSCNFTDYGDRYGKFERSWNGAGLQPWLSPLQGFQATNLLNLTEIPINGPSVLACNTPAQFTTLPNLLDVTYEWTVTTGLQITGGQGTPTVTISAYPNNNVGSGYLTLTLRSPTKGRIRIYTVSKQVFISNGTVLGTYNSPTNNAQPLAPLTRFNPTTNNTCLSVTTNMSIPSGSIVTWSGPENTNEIVWGPSGNNVNIYFSGLNQTIMLMLSVTNSCGTTNLRYSFTCTSTSPCGDNNALKVALSPNPSSSTMQVSLVGKTNDNIRMKISEIRIIDKSGNLKQKNTYGAGQKNIGLNISSLVPDVYTILVFDGRTWTSEKFIKN